MFYLLLYVHFHSSSKHKLEDNFDTFTTLKAADLAKPLREMQISFKIHNVKDHDMKEHLCLKVEHLGFCVIIMESCGLNTIRCSNYGRLDNIRDYYVHHASV
ncbi:hypothetical protein Fmac_005185 [Flemingia macrophylla]|uniref:Uncharacterized protein n=1 Tax=Flemingia macrophylla TaxID=520843 RepID=A0ABD1N755_9FABA